MDLKMEATYSQSIVFFWIGEISPNLKTLPSEQAKVFLGESFRNILPFSGKVKIYSLNLSEIPFPANPPNLDDFKKITQSFQSWQDSYATVFPRSGGWRMRPGNLVISTNPGGRFSFAEARDRKGKWKKRFVDLVVYQHLKLTDIAPETPGLEDDYIFLKKRRPIFFRCYVFVLGSVSLTSFYRHVAFTWVPGTSNFLSNRILEDSDPKSVEIGDHWHNSKNRGYSWILCIIFARRNERIQSEILLTFVSLF